MSKTPDSRCDLHIHSVFSDSDSDLESIFAQARNKGLRCLSLTDHDTVDGVAPAMNYSKLYSVELIAGIEISVQHEGIELHILGYFVDINNKGLKEELADIKVLRRERLIEMGNELNSLGVKVDIEELMAGIGETIPTRLHLGLYLLRKGRGRSLREIFKKYLSPGKPAYKARFKYSVEDAIRLVKNYGGLSFLAHPHMIPDQSWVEEFISLGLDGLEVVYPGMSAAKSSLYRNMAFKFNLLKCGGSDAHGTYKEFTAVGGVNVPYQWVEEMKQRGASLQ